MRAWRGLLTVYKQLVYSEWTSSGTRPRDPADLGVLGKSAEVRSTVTGAAEREVCTSEDGSAVKHLQRGKR